MRLDALNRLAWPAPAGTQRTFALIAALGSGVMVGLHFWAWTGGHYPQSEWPIRISTFIVFGGAVLVTPVDMRSRSWRATFSALPTWLLAMAGLVWAYWLTSFLYFTWDPPARDTSEWYQAFTGRFLIGWAAAALLFFLNSRDLEARHRGSDRQVV